LIEYLGLGIIGVEVGVQIAVLLYLIVMYGKLLINPAMEK
jgi:hypothetical protein